MNGKKVWFPILLGVLALVLFALLLNGRDVPSGRPALTGPAVQNQTVPTLPDQPTVPETSASEPTEPAETEQTMPVRPDPTEQTEPEEPGPEPTEPENTRPEQTEPPAEDEGMFPVQLEGGDLTVRSLFQFTGMNPDADNEFGEDIAGIELTNTSGRHMTTAEVTVIMADGAVLTFQAEDVPAGRTIMAFSAEHASVKDIRGCEEVYGYAVFDSSDPMRTDLVECAVDGIAITVRNVSGAELSDLEVICHGLLDSSYFGGSTYRYNVSMLPAGASTVIYAAECILGMTEVVRVESGS